MKKSIIITAILLSLSSCKKDYVCVCYQADDVTYSHTVDIDATEKDDARTECNQMYHCYFDLKE